MGTWSTPTNAVGNDFVVPQPKQTVRPTIVAAPVPLLASPEPVMSIPVEVQLPSRSETLSFVRRCHDAVLSHSLISFSLLVLLVVGSGIQVASSYYAAHVDQTLAAQAKLTTAAAPQDVIQIAAGAVAPTIAKIAAQTIDLTFGSTSVPVPSATIATWVQQKTLNNITTLTVNRTAVGTSLSQLASPYLKAPVDQVTITQPDGSNQVEVAGSNGTGLADTTKIVSTISNGLLSGNGLQLNVPLQTKNYALLTQASFPKLLEADVTTKRLYAWQNGTLIKTFLATAGAPATPTPLGEFKIWTKLPVQDMSGYNPNGTKYLQPHVQWINYFDHSGDAVHGNYWRPASVFGTTNTSHGCVSVIDSDAEWIYDWAPIGTTVITHA